MLYFHTYKEEVPLSIDIVADIRRLNDLAIKSVKAGMIILGGGVCKHQIANSMLFVRRSLSSSTSTHRRRSETERITQSTSTPDKNSTDRIRERDRTRPCRGGRSSSTGRV